MQDFTKIKPSVDIFGVFDRRPGEALGLRHHRYVERQTGFFSPLEYTWDWNQIALN